MGNLNNCLIGRSASSHKPEPTHSREAMSQWGPTMPRSFTKPKFTPASVAALVRSLRRSPDVTVSKLKTLAKLFA